MRNIFTFAILSLFMFSCNSPEETEETTNSATADYVLIKGAIVNHDGDLLEIFSEDESFVKEIHLGEGGKFSDTLFIGDTVYAYYLSHAGQYTNLFLKKGYNLEVSLDLNDFDKTIKYTGNGADENNTMAKLLLLQVESNIYDLLEVDDQAEYIAGMDNYTKEFNSILNEKTDTDKDLIELQEGMLADMMEQMDYYRTMILEEKALFAKLENQPTPEFINYESIDGSKKSLKDYFGKYIYIDVWATWCGPCKAEAPFLKEIYEEYKDQNITIMSISVDKQTSKDKWSAMVKEEGYGWVNLISDMDFSSEFIEAYGINSIPRFILIGPDGTVIKAGAPRPSSEEIRPLLDSLLK